MTVREACPAFEGSNICTWIGFKHVMYLVEEAVLQHFRDMGFPPGSLYERYGLCLELVSSSVRILHALHIDDRTRFEVRPLTGGAGPEYLVAVTGLVERNGRTVKAVAGRVGVQFRLDDGNPGVESAPRVLAPYVCSVIGRAPARSSGFVAPVVGRGTVGNDRGIIEEIAPSGSNCFVWKWRIPYFYCHFSKRLQLSGYLRIMEEVVDLFLEHRGISIRRLLSEKRWIPVVPEAGVEILSEALMEETLTTVFTVDEIYKDVTYSARMDCYVEREGCLVQTATGRIIHGYAEVVNRHDWSLVRLDRDTLAALSCKR